MRRASARSSLPLNGACRRGCLVPPPSGHYVPGHRGHLLRWCPWISLGTVDAAVVEGRSLPSIARSLGMSKSWVAKQVARYRQGGYEALGRRPSAPHRRPLQTPVELEDEIVALRKQLCDEGLDCGPLTLQYHLRRRHGCSPSRSSIHRVLARRGFISRQPQKRPRSSWQRFEAKLPNETWQADMTHWSIDDGTDEGQKVEVLAFVDDYSRMVVAAVVVPVATAGDVVAAFYKGAAAWGLPASMLTDNGCIFTAKFRNGRCGFMPVPGLKISGQASNYPARFARSQSAPKAVLHGLR